MLPTSVNNIITVVGAGCAVAAGVFANSTNIVRGRRGRAIFAIGLVAFFAGLMQLCLYSSSQYSQGLSFFLIAGLMIGGGLLAAWGRRLGNS